MLPQDSFVRQLSQLDRASSQFSDQLATLLGEERNREHILNLSAQDASWLVDCLDNILDTINPASSAFEGCLCVLVWTCKARRILPKSFTLPGIPLITSSHPIPSGVLADVHEGILDGFKVCLKQPRACSAYSGEDMERVHMSFQEAVIWKHAKHPNIVPFLGITNAPLRLVSNWISGANITEYVKQYPKADRFALLLGVAEALKYLHSRHVVHGDLKGSSVLVDDAGRACLTDFGLATITTHLEPTVLIHKYHSIRWTAPEILRGEIGTNKETDIYSFGMVVIEVFSGTCPFADSPPISVVTKVMMGERPERPKDSILTDELWGVTQRCLDENPQRRPEITEVVSCLRILTGQQDYADVAMVDDTDREGELLYRCSVHGCQLRRCCELERTPEYGPASNGAHSAKPDERWHGTRRVELGGSDTHEGRLWTFTQQYWKMDPQDRPRMDRMIKQLAEQVPQTMLANPVKQHRRENPKARPSATAYAATIHDMAAPPPSLPQAPVYFFGRDEIVDDLLDHTERSTPIALVGAGGIGKTSIALTVLHDARVATRFGDRRHFIKCGDLVGSLHGFLEHLLEELGVPHLKDIAQLRSHLSLSPPHILVLDGIESILDPLVSGAAEIATVIEEFGRCQNVCLLATSRMGVGIPGFCRVEVPALSASGTRDIFHSCCHLGRSVTIDKLLAELDFHPLSIDLLGSVVRENCWDEMTLLEAWNDGKTNILRASGRPSLEDTIKSILGTPAIRELGAVALEMLEAISVFPGGVKEVKLGSMFAGISGVGEAADVLCNFFLIYRQGGFVKMLSPFRFYFLESMRTHVIHSGSDTAHDHAVEHIQYTRRDVAESVSKGPLTGASARLPKGKLFGVAEWTPAKIVGRTSVNEPPGTGHGQQPRTAVVAKSIERIRCAKRKLLAIFRLHGGLENHRRT